MTIDIWAFIKEANATFPEYVWKEWKNRRLIDRVDMKNSRVLNDKWVWIRMPEDDGYDKAFFYLLKHPNASYEEVCFHARCNPFTLNPKLYACGYTLNFIFPWIMDKTVTIGKFYEEIDSYFLSLKTWKELST